MQEKSVNTKLALGYGVGVVGEGIGYNVFYSFFVYFLVNIAGIDSVIAGTISLLAVIWDGITDPMIGYFSDHTRNPKGRRRPLLFKGAFVWCFAIILMFHDVPLEGTAKVVYFVFLNVIFWFSGTMCVIPHSSLGADLTDDYNGRNKLRAFAAFGLNIGMLIATGVTLMVVGFFRNLTDGTEKSGWAYTALVYGLLVLAAYMTTYFSTKGREKENPNVGKPAEGKFSLGKVLKEYFESFRNSPFRKLLIATVIVNFVVGVASSLNVYMYTEAYGFSDATASLMYTINGFSLLGFTVITGLIVNKLGKKTNMVMGLVIYGVAYLIVQFLPLNYTTAVLNAVLVGWGSATYWTLLYSMCYDCGIVSMLKNGESKDGLYTSAIGFFMKFGTAIGMWIVGLGLDFIHYDPVLTAQTAETVSGLRLLFTLPNGIILLVGAFVMLRYGMDKKAYETLEAAFENKQKGEAYDLGEYADMIR